MDSSGFLVGNREPPGPPQWPQSGNNALNEHMASLALGTVGQQLHGATSRITRVVESMGMKYYFNVNTSYVLNKLKIIVFPFHARSKSWVRSKPEFEAEGREEQHYLPPRDDINAPDLYIPTMAFVTYILLIGLAYGAADKFSPELLGVTASSGCVALVLEVLVVKTGFFLLNAPAPVLLDLIAFVGYKYVGLAMDVMVGILFGSPAYYISVCFMASCISMFLLKTFRRILCMDVPQAAGHFAASSSHTHHRTYFLIFLIMIQLPLALFLTRAALTGGGGLLTSSTARAVAHEKFVAKGHTNPRTYATSYVPPQEYGIGRPPGPPPVEETRQYGREEVILSPPDER